MQINTNNGHPFELLTPDFVIDAVESLGLLSDARILTLNSYENRVYQVGIDEAEPVIVKVYRPERWSEEQIREDHEYTEELAGLEISVVPPMRINGDTLHKFNGFSYAIYPRRGGRAPALDDLDSLHTIGRFVGRIHAVGKTRPFKYRPKLDVKERAEDSRFYLLNSGVIPPSLKPAYESVSDELINEVKACFAKWGNYDEIRLHGDCHVGNILWRDDTPHFVDFDDCISGPAMQDLWLMLSGDRYEKTKQLCELIEGYEEFCDFNPRELNLIEALRSMRIIHYSAWLGRRWDDPAFPKHFPWFGNENYWAGHILELKEQLSAMAEPALKLKP